MYKKSSNFGKCFFLRSYISEVTAAKFTKPISHFNNGLNSDQKKFFWKICIFRKVTGPTRILVSKILSNTYFGPPPRAKNLLKPAQIFRFFQNSPNGPITCWQGFSNSKFSIFSTKKSRVASLVFKTAPIQHSAIFQNFRFFHVFKVFCPHRGRKSDFYTKHQFASKSVYRGIFRRYLRFSGRKIEKRPIRGSE